MWGRSSASHPEPQDILTLVPFYCGEREGMLDALVREISREFHVQVVRQAPSFDPEEAYDASRGQYDTRALISRLLDQPATADRILAVTDVDLFVPVLTFVFGEAQMGGRVAVVSSYRLAPEKYGLPPDANLLEDRLIKEAIHELGHAYGLAHCSDIRCVMTSSPAVEGIDLKTSSFCAACERALRPAAQKKKGFLSRWVL